MELCHQDISTGVVVTKIKNSVVVLNVHVLVKSALIYSLLILHPLMIRMESVSLLPFEGACIDFVLFVKYRCFQLQ